jgi:VanZ family protein
MFLLVAVAVLYALFRQEPPPLIFEKSDKVGHALAFFSVSVSLLLLLKQSGWKKELTALVLVLIFAVASEYIQGSALLPKRHQSMGDIYANLAGGLLGFMLVKIRSHTLTWRKAI